MVLLTLLPEMDFGGCVVSSTEEAEVAKIALISLGMADFEVFVDILIEGIREEKGMEC